MSSQRGQDLPTAVRFGQLRRLCGPANEINDLPEDACFFVGERLEDDDGTGWRHVRWSCRGGRFSMSRLGMLSEEWIRWHTAEVRHR